MNIQQIINNPHIFGNSVSINKLVKILNYASKHYYNFNKEIMTDEIYDILLNILQKRDPDNEYLKSIGHPVSEPIKLPFPMPSLTKIKSDIPFFYKWLKVYSGPYHISDKIDGVSCLFYNNKLYSRGDGYFGQDITHLKKFIKGLPLNFNKINYAIRGELIILKKDFHKYKNVYKNPRNTVAGQVNSLKKNVNKQVATDITFIAYEIIYPFFTVSEQYNELNKLDFILPSNQIVGTLDLEQLNKILIQNRIKSIYDIDGIVVKNCSNKIINGIEDRWAYKLLLSDKIVETIVLSVQWNLSKYGYLKPVLLLEPVKLCTIEIKKVTGFNAQYILTNKIGPGTIITIERSGDVIPHIVKINKSTTAQMPNIDYLWTKSKIDIYIKNIKQNKDVQIQIIYNFFKTIGTKDLGKTLITKLFVHGQNTILKIIKMTINDFLSIPNIKIKLATKLYNNIHYSIKHLQLSTLMVGSNIFGRGISGKKIQLFLKHYDIFKHHGDVPIIPNMSQKTIDQIMVMLPTFIKFYNSGPFQHIKYVPTLKTIVFSGFRDADLEHKVNKLGLTVVNNVSKDTHLLIVKNINQKTNKILLAQKLGTKIIQLDDFLKKYNL